MDDPMMHRISLVIPVYCGEKSLETLVGEIAPLTQEQTTPGGTCFKISEVLLVHDCGPDRSDRAIEFLSAQYSFVRPVWLSRNYGQHAATLAGMASSTGDWIATIDEMGSKILRILASCLIAPWPDRYNLFTRNPRTHLLTVGCGMP